MEKEILERILTNPLLPQIKEKLEKFRAVTELTFVTRDCKDPKYNEIPSVRFKLRNIKDDDEILKFYSICLRAVKATCNITNIDRDLTVTYANLNAYNNDKSYRNIDIYLKHMTSDKQAQTFDILAKTFNSLLNRIDNEKFKRRSF